MKQLLSLLLLLAAALACSQFLPSATVTPPPVTIQETTTPSPTPAATDASAPSTETSAPFPGLPISFGALNLVIPPGLATTTSGTTIPALTGDDVAPWEIAPEHLQLTLDGYLLQDKFHQPRLYVYPAGEYAALMENIANNLVFIKGICCRAENIPDSASLPSIPFFNAGPVFASNIRILNFQNGQGVRFLTQYAQYFAFVNNTDLFYQYQGLTEDGQAYIIAILPVTATVLPTNADPQTALPPGGIAQPSYDDPNADWAGYYQNLTALLESTPSGSFTPTLAQLDALIQSIFIAP